MTAALSVVCTLPLLAQSTSSVTQLIIPGKGKNRIEVRCKNTKDLAQCVDGVQGLSAKDKSLLKGMAPRLQKQLDEALSRAQDRSNTCFALRVYQYPKGFPEENGKAQAKVSECTSAAHVKEKTMDLHAKTLKATPQH
jgi:hypothetical protein